MPDNKKRKLVEITDPSLLEGEIIESPSSSLDTSKLSEEIAQVESKGNYGATNPSSSATGKYQFLWGEAPGKGFQDDIKKVTGVQSREEFLSNPDAQEKFFEYHVNKNIAPAINELRQYNKQGYSDSQLAKLVHFKGKGGAMEFLTSGADKTTAHNISIPSYIGEPEAAKPHLQEITDPSLLEGEIITEDQPQVATTPATPAPQEAPSEQGVLNKIFGVDITGKPIVNKDFNTLQNTSSPQLSAKDKAIKSTQVLADDAITHAQEVGLPQDLPKYLQDITNPVGDPKVTGDHAKYRMAQLKMDKDAAIAKLAHSATPGDPGYNEELSAIENEFDGKIAQLKDAAVHTTSLQLANREFAKKQYTPAEAAKKISDLTDQHKAEMSKVSPAERPALALNYEQGKAAIKQNEKYDATQLGIEQEILLGNKKAEADLAKYKSGLSINEDRKVAYQAAGLNAMQTAAQVALENGNAIAAKELNDHSDDIDGRLMKDNPKYFKKVLGSEVGSYVFNEVDNPIYGTILSRPKLSEDELKKYAKEAGLSKDQIAMLTPDDVPTAASLYAQFGQSAINAFTFDNEGNLLTGKTPQEQHELNNWKGVLGEVAGGAGTVAGFMGQTMIGGEFLKGAKVLGDVALNARRYETVSNMLPLAISNYNNAYATSKEVIGDKPEDEGKRQAYSLLNATLSTAIMTIDPATALGKNALGLTSEGKSIINSIKKDGLENITKDEFKSKIQKVLASVVKATEETGEHTAKQAFIMSTSKAAENVTNMFFDPEHRHSVMDETGDAAIHAAVAMFIPSLFAGVRASGSQTPVNKAMLWDIGSNSRKYRDEVNKLYREGKLSKDEVNQSINNINTAAGIVNVQIPRESVVNNKELTQDQKQTYAYNLLQEKELQKQVDALPESETTQRGLLSSKLKDLDNERKQILTDAGYVPGYVKPIHIELAPKEEKVPAAKNKSEEKLAQEEENIISLPTTTEPSEETLVTTKTETNASIQGNEGLKGSPNEEIGNKSPSSEEAADREKRDEQQEAGQLKAKPEKEEVKATPETKEQPLPVSENPAKKGKRKFKVTDEEEAPATPEEALSTSLVEVVVAEPKNQQHLVGGSTTKWDVYGNEAESEWNVGGKSTTRGGKEAVILWRYEDAFTGEAKTSPGDNTKKTEHVVALSDLARFKGKESAVVDVNKQGGEQEHARAEQAGSEVAPESAESGDSNIGGKKKEVKPLAETKKLSHTKGVFSDIEGKLYKSTEDKSGKPTSEHEIATSLQDIDNVVRVGKEVNTSEGPAFEMEELTPLKKGEKITLEEAISIRNTMEEMDKRGIFAGELEFGRDKDGNIKIFDLSMAERRKDTMDDQNYSTVGNAASNIAQHVKESDKKAYDGEVERRMKARMAEDMEGFDWEGVFNVTPEDRKAQEAKQAQEDAEEAKKASFIKQRVNGAIDAEIKENEKKLAEEIAKGDVKENKGNVFVGGEIDGKNVNLGDLNRKKREAKKQAFREAIFAANKAREIAEENNFDADRIDRAESVFKRSRKYKDRTNSERIAIDEAYSKAYALSKEAHSKYAKDKEVAGKNYPKLTGKESEGRIGKLKDENKKLDAKLGALNKESLILRDEFDKCMNNPSCDGAPIVDKISQNFDARDGVEKKIKENNLEIEHRSTIRHQEVEDGVKTPEAVSKNEISKDVQDKINMVKEKYPDAIPIVAEKGTEQYHIYGEDAKVASDILGIKVIDGRVTINKSSLDGALTKLIKAGHKAAIAEDNEPIKAKGKTPQEKQNIEPAPARSVAPEAKKEKKAPATPKLTPNQQELTNKKTGEYNAVHGRNYTKQVAKVTSAQKRVSAYEALKKGDAKRVSLKDEYVSDKEFLKHVDQKPPKRSSKNQSKIGTDPTNRQKQRKEILNEPPMSIDVWALQHLLGMDDNSPEGKFSTKSVEQHLATREGSEERGYVHPFVNENGKDIDTWANDIARDEKRWEGLNLSDPEAIKEAIIPLLTEFEKKEPLQEKLAKIFEQRKEQEEYWQDRTAEDIKADEFIPTTAEETKAWLMGEDFVKESNQIDVAHLSEQEMMDIIEYAKTVLDENGNIDPKKIDPFSDEYQEVYNKLGKEGQKILDHLERPETSETILETIKNEENAKRKNTQEVAEGVRGNESGKPGEDVAARDAQVEEGGPGEKGAGSKEEAVSKKFDIDGKDIFYHASDRPRKGRLKKNHAPQFGEAVYFSTNKDYVVGEFGDNVTEVELNIKNPLYTFSPEFYKVEEHARELWREKELNYDAEEDEYTYKKNGQRADGKNGEVGEDLSVNYLNEAAKEMGYDAFIERGNEYENEIAVLDESKIVYPEDKKLPSELNDKRSVATEAKSPEEPLPTRTLKQIDDNILQQKASQRLEGNLRTKAEKAGNIEEANKHNDNWNKKQAKIDRLNEEREKLLAAEQEERAEKIQQPWKNTAASIRKAGMKATAGSEGMLSVAPLVTSKLIRALTNTTADLVEILGNIHVAVDAAIRKFMRENPNEKELTEEQIKALTDHFSIYRDPPTVAPDLPKAHKKLAQQLREEIEGGFSTYNEVVKEVMDAEFEYGKDRPYSEEASDKAKAAILNYLDWHNLDRETFNAETLREPKNEKTYLNDYALTQSDMVSDYMSGKTTQDVFGGEVDYDINSKETQLQTLIVQDAANMIGLAKFHAGSDDVLDYGTDMLGNIKKMPDGENGQSVKKLLAVSGLSNDLHAEQLRITNELNTGKPDFNRTIELKNRQKQLKKMIAQTDLMYRDITSNASNVLNAARANRVYRNTFFAELYADRILNDEMRAAKNMTEEALGKTDVPEDITEDAVVRSEKEGEREAADVIEEKEKSTAGKNVESDITGKEAKEKATAEKKSKSLIERIKEKVKKTKKEPDERGRKETIDKTTAEKKAKDYLGDSTIEDLFNKAKEQTKKPC